MPRSNSHPIDRVTRPSWVLQIAGVVAVVYLLLIGFPGGYYAIEPGLDPSWVYGLNRFWNSSYAFGRDINFTYGPLGFLLYPQNIGHDVLGAVAFRLTATAAFGWVMLALGRGRPLATCFFVAGYAIALALGQTFDFHLQLVLALGAFLALRRHSFRGLLGIAVLSAPLGLVKFSLGAASFALIVLATAAFIAAGGRAARGLAIVLAHLATAGAVALACTRSATSTALWLRASVEMTSGYSSAMSFSPGWNDALLGVLSGAIWLLAMLVLAWLRRPAASYAFLLAGPFFLMFKAGFVREDAHAVSFHAFAVGAAASLLLVAENTADRAIGLAATLSIWATAWAGLVPRRYFHRDTAIRVLSTEQGRTNFFNALHTRQLKRSLERDPAGPLATDRLTPDLRAAIGSSGVVVLPWEIAICAADRLNCVPLPTMQAYANYTPWLDQFTAGRFSDAAAPPFVLVHTLESIDGRHAMLDSPLTWRALLRGYQALPGAEPRGPLLLAKTAAPPNVKERDRGTSVLHFNEWLDLPASSGLLFAHPDLALKPLGHLAKFAYRIPALYLELLFADGRIRRHRLVADTASEGLLVSQLPAGLAEFAALEEGVHLAAPVRLRVVGSATRYYRNSVTVRWTEAPLPSIQPAKARACGITGNAHLDSANGIEQPSLPVAIEVDQRDGAVALRGWALLASREPGAALRLTIDRRLEVPLVYGLDRPDVAASFSWTTARFGGFEGAVQASALGVGRHSLGLEVVARDGSCESWASGIDVLVK